MSDSTIYWQKIISSKTRLLFFQLGKLSSNLSRSERNFSADKLLGMHYIAINIEHFKVYRLYKSIINIYYITFLKIWLNNTEI